MLYETASSKVWGLGRVLNLSVLWEECQYGPVLLYLSSFVLFWTPPPLTKCKVSLSHRFCCMIPASCGVSLPATCWGFIGPVFIRKGSPPSNAKMGSLTSPLWVCAGLLLLFNWMISSKSAASPLADKPFWWVAGWTPFTTGADTAALCRFPAAADWEEINKIRCFLDFIVMK